MKKFLALILVCLALFTFAACSPKDEKVHYDLGSADRARAFYNTYESILQDSNQGSEVNGVLHGAAVVRLADFTGDGYPELLMAYSDKADGVVNRLSVWGFDMGLAEIYSEEITSKANADDEYGCVWIYTDVSGISYLVMGEDLSRSRSYLSYQQADLQGKALYAFAEAFSTDGKDLNGTYEKIAVSGNEAFGSITEINEGVISALENQKN